VISGVVWGLIKGRYYQPWQGYILVIVDVALLAIALFYQPLMTEISTLIDSHWILYFLALVALSSFSFRPEMIALSMLLSVIVWLAGAPKVNWDYLALFVLCASIIVASCWLLRRLVSKQLLAEQEYYTLLATQSPDAKEDSAEERPVEYIDRLTTLGTRAAFERDSALFTNIFAEGRLNDLTIAFIDIDDPKTLIKAHGQQEYKRMLRAFAEASRKKFRSSDMVYRFSSDQFVLLAPGSTMSNAERLQNILASISEQVIAEGFDGFKATMGVSTLGEVQAQGGEI
jgi:diguanylate cyclase (GGDEF)-like protein